jgi:nitrogen fixation protein FixH
MNRKLIAAALAVLVGCTEAPIEPDVPIRLDAEGTNGQLAFVLRSVAPLAEGANDFEVEVRSGDELVSDAEVRLVLSMPAMNHTAPEADADPVGDGTYAADAVILSMPGTWQVEIAATAGALSDVVEFEIEVTR